MRTAKNITVTRAYGPEPEDCARALALLLKKSASKTAAKLSQPSGPDGTRIKGDSANVILPE